MIMELFPHPRRMTDQELQDRIDRIVASWDAGRDGLIGWATAGFEREQRRRAAMTSHERIVLARSLAEERDAGRRGAQPDPIEIISPNPDTSTLEGRISPSRDRTDAMIAPRQPTPTPTAADHRTPRGGPWPPGGVSWVGGRAR